MNDIDIVLEVLRSNDPEERRLEEEFGQHAVPLPKELRPNLTSYGIEKSGRFRPLCSDLFGGRVWIPHDTTYATIEEAAVAWDLYLLRGTIHRMGYTQTIDRITARE